jgi:hypothetical protein
LIPCGCKQRREKQQGLAINYMQTKAWQTTGIDSMRMQTKAWKTTGINYVRLQTKAWKTTGIDFMRLQIKAWKTTGIDYMRLNDLCLHGRRWLNGTDAHKMCHKRWQWLNDTDAHKMCHKRWWTTEGWCARLQEISNGGARKVAVSWTHMHTCMVHKAGQCHTCSCTVAVYMYMWVYGYVYSMSSRPIYGLSYIYSYIYGVCIGLWTTLCLRPVFSTAGGGWTPLHLCRRMAGKHTCVW